ncbi:hypothetical protein [Bifidobacterium miconisargentati]|uniref:hypothetical protein n=1 Tax=Bifidobacterium miconisargentati TaxID=2834437 RepID=UPI001BDD8BA5|nr:hypothetical protein [Bifidobacterium miconisargentati]MBW3090028.1 hypothetical protein [Bifidobacterium miconisargentati]
MKTETDWMPGDERLARRVWLRRRGHWILFTLGAVSIAMGVGGLILAPLDDWLNRVTHGDSPVDMGWVVLALIVATDVLYAFFYLRWRLRGRPEHLLAVPTKDWPVQPIAFPDTTDDDGDPVKGDIEYILFTPDTDRTFTVPLRTATGTRIGDVTVRDGRARLETVRDTAAVRLRADANDRIGWLEEGLNYDDDSDALLVGDRLE